MENMVNSTFLEKKLAKNGGRQIRDSTFTAQTLHSNFSKKFGKTKKQNNPFQKVWQKKDGREQAKVGQKGKRGQIRNSNFLEKSLAKRGNRGQTTHSTFSKKVGQKGNRGQISGLYLVLLTVLLMGITIGYYITSGGNLAGHIVSPSPVLSMEMAEDLFVLEEKRLLIDSFEEARAELGEAFELESAEFRERAREIFLGKMEASTVAEVFLMYETSDFSGSDIPEGYFEHVLYPLFDFESKEIIVHRMTHTKSFLLKAKEGSVAHFPVVFTYSFSKTYRVTFDGETFIIDGFIIDGGGVA